MRTIASGDAVTALLAAAPELSQLAIDEGASRARPSEFFLDGIGHHLYAGDTALHVAAAAYLVPLARDLVSLGANVAAGNRRRAQPLHYAADGNPVSVRWNPIAQAETIVYLISVGADPDATGPPVASPLASGGAKPMRGGRARVARRRRRPAPPQRKRLDSH